ncbi:hypothetical protein OCK72_06630 [Fusobacterium simiae]|uniref:Uncharacterized protein n=1 Tax=Fusobacterium simiae TaxID=855 RepID=A0ABT4DM08_FUSSI|nr:hypothetical protein [Fusobacterium simiae]MCY7008329.1 hypothetical protein [Fusobacterium simiae]
MKKMFLALFLLFSYLCFAEWEYVPENNSVTLKQGNNIITLADGGGGSAIPIFHYSFEQAFNEKKPIDTYGLYITIDENTVIKANAIIMGRIMRFPVEGMITDKEVFNELIPQMQSGKMMRIKFMSKKYDDILIEIPLDNFNESYRQMLAK